MNGPRWVDNNIIIQKQREAQYQKHVQKVTDIVKNPKKSLGIDQNMVKLQQSIYNAKSFNMHFNENQRLNQINKQNQMLLDKLIEISEGKQSTIKQQIHTAPLSDKQNLRAMSQKRKQAAMQIYTENQQLAQRLLNQRSFINKQQIQKEIEEYEKLKAHMQKVKPSIPKKRNVSAHHHSNLPPIIQHTKNSSANMQNRRKLKKINNSNTLNKSAYDINHNTYNPKRIREDNLNYLNQSEADIIINQYDNAYIENSNSMPAYQQSHSANIHNSREREYGFTSHPSSIRGSQNLIHAAILEEDDQTENYGQKNNQISNFYRNANRTPSQHYSNNNNHNLQEEIQQQNQYQNNQKYNLEKQQNQNYTQNESQNKSEDLNTQNKSKNDSIAQSHNNSLNQSYQSYKLSQQQNNQQQQQQQLQDISNRNSIPHQSKQESNKNSNQQSNQQSQQLFLQQQQQKQDSSPIKQNQELPQYALLQNSPHLSNQQEQYQSRQFPQNQQISNQQLQQQQLQQQQIQQDVPKSNK